MTMPGNKSLKADYQSALLTVKEVAALDNCCVKTVRRAIAAGLLDAVRVGPGRRLLRIDPAAHAAYRARLR
jgi:excisionase family DNA binding protein